MNDILDMAAAIFGVSTKDIVRRTKSRRVSQARQAVYWAARKRTNYSLEEIGQRIGGRNHTSVMYGLQAAEERAKVDPGYALDLAGLL